MATYRSDGRFRFRPIEAVGKVCFRAERLQLNLRGYAEGVVNLDAQIADSALKLSVTNK